MYSIVTVLASACGLLAGLFARRALSCPTGVQLLKTSYTHTHTHMQPQVERVLAGADRWYFDAWKLAEVAQASRQPPSYSQPGPPPWRAISARPPLKPAAYAPVLKALGIHGFRLSRPAFAGS